MHCSLSNTLWPLNRIIKALNNGAFARFFVLSKFYLPTKSLFSSYYKMTIMAEIVRSVICWILFSCLVPVLVQILIKTNQGALTKDRFDYYCKTQLGFYSKNIKHKYFMRKKKVWSVLWHVKTMNKMIIGPGSI